MNKLIIDAANEKIFLMIIVKIIIIVFSMKIAKLILKNE